MSPILYGLLVTLFGLVIVFLVLIALWGILAMMKSLFGGKKKQEKSHDIVQKELAPTIASMTREQAETSEAADEELIAVIMAAINASMGSQSNLVIRSITRVGDSTPVWGQIGRHEQMLNRF